MGNWLKDSPVVKDRVTIKTIYPANNPLILYGAWAQISSAIAQTRSRRSQPLENGYKTVRIELVTKSFNIRK